MCVCQFGQNPLIVPEERVQTRSYADWILTKSSMPPPPLFGGRGGRGYNLALIDPVVSEKMFEECGRRACLYDKLTNQYIKRSARIIRSMMSY